MKYIYVLLFSFMCIFTACQKFDHKAVKKILEPKVILIDAKSYDPEISNKAEENKKPLRHETLKISDELIIPQNFPVDIYFDKKARLVKVLSDDSSITLGFYSKKSIGELSKVIQHRMKDLKWEKMDSVFGLFYKKSGRYVNYQLSALHEVEGYQTSITIRSQYAKPE